MDKRTAIKVMNSHYHQEVFNNSNALFSNINACKDVWWFDIPLKKLSSHIEINLLVYDYKARVIHHLCVPINYLKTRLDKLHIREDRKCISLELSTEEYMLFKDIRPRSGKLNFSQYLKASVTL